MSKLRVYELAKLLGKSNKELLDILIDLGVDVAPEKFLAKVDERPGSIVGLSALLTTTMVNMDKTTKMIKEKHPNTLVVVGGAPLTQEFCDKIGADAYSPDPQGIIEWLNAKVA